METKPERVVMVDIDSTITDHWKRIRRNTYPQWPGGNIEARAFTRAEVMKDGLIRGCDIALQGINVFHPIKYLTARGWADADDITQSQLMAFGLPNPHDVVIVPNMHAKLEVLTKAKPWAYIDDFMTGQENAVGTFHHGIAMAIQNLGIHVVVFRNDWTDVVDQLTIYEDLDSRGRER